MTETSVNWDDAYSETGDDKGGGPEFVPGPMPRQTTRGANRGRGRRVSDKRLSALQEKLNAEMFTAGAMIGFGAPVTGYYIGQESDNFTQAIVQLASKNTRWVEALENIAMLGPGIIIGRTTFGIAASLATDRYHRTEGEKGLNPDTKAAVFLGVTTAYYAVHPPEGMGGTSATGANANGYNPPPHGTFTPVS